MTSIESRIQVVIDRWQVSCGSGSTSVGPVGRLLRDLELAGARRDAERAAESLFRELVVATRSGRSAGDLHVG